MSQPDTPDHAPGDPEPAPPPSLEERVDRIVEGYLDRLQSGERPDRGAILAENPELAGLLDRRLNLVEMIHDARPPGDDAPRTPMDGSDGDGDGDDTLGDSGFRVSIEPPAATGGRPERIGPYRVLETLGEGGMGIVYLAEQKEPLRRRVALKLVKEGMDTRDVLARFESERQALALMNHEAIARVLEAGSSETGRPYFAMEYVPGVALTDYADRNRLSTRERLELFCRICDGIQHAHQKGIIHRDLKPSNILVTANGRAVPKIIDFGVAKATNQRLTESTAFTEYGRVIGTPEYMSPEQAEITSLDVDTRTDIYSLGVILYELLVGATPFDSRELRAVGLTELRRRIREEDPPKPSTRISTLGEASTDVAKARRTNPASLSRLLRGDLDWITMKAMEKDRTRRYATASELKADIERHVSGLPVLAGPPGAGYLLRKFVLRHRVGVALALVVAALLVAGIVGASSVAVARARADLRVARYGSLTYFLETLLGSENPFAAAGRDVTVAELVDAAAARLDEDDDLDPDLSAEMKKSIGWTYYVLGEHGRAKELLSEALAEKQALLGPRDRETLDVGVRLGRAELALDEIETARSRLEEIYALSREELGPDDPDTLSTARNLGLARRLSGDLAGAKRLLEETLARQSEIGDPSAPWVLKTVGHLAGVEKDLGNHEEAEKLYLEALRGHEGDGGPETAWSLGLRNNLGSLYMNQDRHAEAEVHLQASLAGTELAYGPLHQRTLAVRHNLAGCARLRGDLDEAEKRYMEVLELEKEAYPAGHTQPLITTFGLGGVRLAAGRAADAIPPLEEVVRELRGRPGLEYVHLQAMNTLAGALVEENRLDRAWDVLSELQDAAASYEHLREDDPALFEATRGRYLVRRGDLDGGERLLRRSLETLKRIQGEDHRLTRRVRSFIDELEAARAKESGGEE